jgi:ABC-type multidrug transport system permease subunit
MSSLDELRQLTRTRIVLFLREPEAVFWVVIFPVVLAFVLSIAFKGRAVGDARVGILEEAAAQPWVATLRAAGGIEVVLFPTRAAAERKLRSGALVALVEAGEPLTVRYDPSRAEAELARLRIEAAVQRPAGGAQPARVATLHVTEHGSRYIDFLVPGLLGMNLMSTGMWGTAFAIVDWRQKKLLKRLVVTPMRRTSFLFAQMLSRFAFLVLEVSVIVAFGVLALDVPFRGSLVGFALLCVLGALSFSGLGLLVASRSQTVEGVSGLMNFVMMPMWLFSGIFFSYENFPRMFQPFIRLLPLTALNDGLRALMLEGDRLGSLLPETGLLVAWTLAAFFVALRVFRWQ